MNTLKRLLLLFSYVAVSIALILLCKGDNSNVPVQSFFILASWSILIYARTALGGLPLFIAIFVLYLLALFFLGNRLRQKTRSRVPFMSLIIHSVGTIICIMMPGGYALEAGFITNFLAWIIPLGLAFLYFYLDWQLGIKSELTPKANSGV